MKKEFKKLYDGFQWIYTSGEHSLSVVLHFGSYGNKSGLFETMCSWKPDVQGYLDFGQVQQKIKTIYKLEKKEGVKK
jgi:hypothetical protein